MAEPIEKLATTSAEERLEAGDIDRYVSFCIRQRRIDLGLTAEQMAKLIGVSRSQVHKYEVGINKISAGRLYKIASALKVEVVIKGYSWEFRSSTKRLAQGKLPRENRNPEVRSDEGVNPWARTLPAPMKFAAKLQEIWQLHRNDLGKLLGFESEEGVLDLLSGARRFESRDTKDRLRHLMRIREALHSLFRDIDAERQWLRESRPELQGQSPLALLLEGSMENLLTVSQFVQWMVGR